MMLVYRLPGPMTIRSASSIARRASSPAATFSGESQTRSICVDFAMTDWPVNSVPSTSRAWSVTAVPVAGTTWPRTARTRFICLTPSSKSSPWTEVIAASSRLPTVCPVRLASAPPANRYWSRSAISGSESASAAMQLRMSPTAGMPSSSRRRPEDPPSSATVTTAVMLLVCSLMPRSSVERPVPPPITAIFGPRDRNRFWYITSTSG